MLSFISLLSIFALVVSGESFPRRTNYVLPQELHRENLRILPKGRLSADVVPTDYAIRLTLESDAFEKNVFSGIVDIQFDINKDVSLIQLHAKDLNIIGVTLDKTGGIDIIMEGPDLETDLVTVTQINGTNFTKGTGYQLTITYSGILSETEMVGFYKSSYTDGTETKYLAATQFESTHARRAFPCFDEPALKATFTVTLNFPKTYTAMSNTEISSSIPDPDDENLQRVKFKQTPLMSTYLVAFIVSEFKCTAGATVDGIPTEVCSRPGTEDTTKIAQETAPQILAAMQAYTGLSYKDFNIGKLTQAAIPDFSAGAMENWGLTTFREVDLLWDENESSNYYKQLVVTVVSHELSHQWFGDLVTLDWWSDIFLNEGFATYFQYYAADVDHKDWELTKQFVIEQLQVALLTDSQKAVLPLSVADGVVNNFDDVSYNKGGSIFRMVHYILGLENFQKGLTDYMSAHKNDIGTPETLWESLNKFAGELADPQKLPDELGTVMDNWTHKQGYPLLTVKSDGDNVVISQKQFLLSGTGDTKWYVPITYTTTKDFTDTTTKAWLTPTGDLTLKGVLKDASWFVLNNQQTGYYRVTYDDTLWDKISTVLDSKNFNDIDEISRSQIVDDLLNLARAGTKTYTNVLNTLKFLKRDDSYYTWYAAFNGFSYLLKRTSDETLTKLLTDYLTEITETLYASTPIDKLKSDDQIYTLKQVLALTWACHLNDTACVEPATQSFTDYASNNTNKPPVNLRSVVYCNGLRYSENATKDFEFLWGEYTASTLSTEKTTILQALGCANDETVLTTYLEKALTTDVRLQDARYVFSSVYANDVVDGVGVALDFVTTKYKDINDHFDDEYATVNSQIAAIADLFTTQAEIDKLQKFIDSEGLEDAVKTAATSAVTVAKDNLKITKALEGNLKQYFNGGDDDNNSAVLNSAHLLNIALVLLGYIVFNL